MKSLAELQAIKEKTVDSVIIPEGSSAIRVVVGMATCGMAAGATPVLEALKAAVEAEKLTDKVTVSQTGCIGLCQFEPIVEVHEAGKEKTTYVKMNAEKVARIVEEHLKGGKPVADFTLDFTRK